jgi:acetyl esterase/lipase
MKKITLSLGLFIFLQVTVFPQDNPVMQEEIIYKTTGDFELKVDMFYTASSHQNKDNPAIAFFHGGGWVFGNRDEFHEACRRYARKGFVTFSFQYRLSINPDGSYPHPGITPVESVKDARSAIRWLRENANRFHINPDKIIASGQSAGGQLALATALMDSVNEVSDNLTVSPVPNALLLYSSNVNTMEAWIDLLFGDRREEIWSISPYHNLTKNMPPAIAFHGEDDCTVLPYIIDLFKIKMHQLGNHYELYTFPGRKHYLGENSENYARYFDEEILERTDTFLHQFGFIPEGN